jgi:hypothetical protein
MAQRMRLIKKRIIVSMETKKRGGNAGRLLQRSLRKHTILQEKTKVTSDLVRSWGLGEIGRPTEEERMLFYLYPGTLTWKYILEVKKKYWHGNI